MPPEFHFLRPLWLLMLLPLGGLLWFLARRGGGASAWRGVVDPHLLAHLLTDEGGRARRAPLVLLAAAWLLGVLALAGPVWERLPRPVYQVQAQRVIALDISPTMNATDVPPSRLARARFEVLDMLKRASEGQTALLAYGAEPFVVSPLTNDTRTIAAQVPSLETSLLPVEGPRRTDLALQKAAALLEQAGSTHGQVILVTDGLDNPAAADTAALKLRARGYRVSVLGVGTQKGAPVPMPDGGFLKDASGAILMPKLEQDALEKLAAAGGGRYVPASLDDRDVDTLVPPTGAQLDDSVKRQDLTADEWREEGPWLLLLLLPLAALAFRRGWLSPLVLVLLLVPPPPAQAFDWQDLWLRPDQQAARDLAAGKAKEAAKRFERPDWRAAAHYKAGDYKAALDSLDKLSGPQAAYNRGNSLAQLGELGKAVKAYDKALAADPKNADARFNRDLVEKLLEQQKQQQQQGKSGQKGKSGKQDGQQNQAGADQGNQAQDQQGQKGPGQKDANGKQSGNQKPSQQAQQDEGGRQGTNKQQASGKQAKSQSAQQPKQDKGKAHSAGAQGKEKDRRQAGAAGTQEDTSERQAGAQPGKEQQAGANSPRKQDAAPEPGRADLLGGQQRLRQPGASPKNGIQDTAKREQAQAMQEMLRRVPDDPGGLLRQRFLLQHLRRTGELP